MDKNICILQGVGMYAGCMLALSYCYAFCISLYLFLVRGVQRSKLNDRLLSSHVISLSLVIIGGSVAISQNAFVPNGYVCSVLDLELSFFLYYTGVFVSLPASIWTTYEIISLLWKEQRLLNNPTIILIVTRMSIFLSAYSISLILMILYLPSSMFWKYKINGFLNVIFDAAPTLFAVYFILTKV